MFYRLNERMFTMSKKHFIALAEALRAEKQRREEELLRASIRETEAKLKATLLARAKGGKL